MIPKPPPSSKLFSAKAAREMADEAAETQLEVVMEAIKKAIDTGRDKDKYHCYIYESLTPSVIEKLTSLGYTCQNADERNEVITKISW